MATTKKCPWCGQELPLTGFHNEQKTRQKGGEKYKVEGVQDICKRCNKYRTMFFGYGKMKDKLPDMILEKKLQIMLMEMKLTGVKARDAVSIVTTKSY